MWIVFLFSKLFCFPPEFTVTVEGNSHPTTLDVASSQPVNSVESYSVRLTHTGNWTKFYFLKCIQN